MSRPRFGWLTERWSRLTSGTKMLLILSLALLPLGIVAIWATIYSARQDSVERAEQTLARLEDKSELLNELIARSIGTMRAAGAAVAAAPEEPVICDRVLSRLSGLQTAPGRFALYDADGKLRCASGNLVPESSPAGDASGQNIEISPDGEALRLTLFAEDGSVEAFAEYDRNALRDLTFLPGTVADFDLELIGNSRRMELRDDYRRVPLVRTIADSTPVAGGRLDLHIRVGSVPVRPIDVLLIILPVLMWIGAAVIAGWVLHRQILRPLATITGIVRSYRPGDRPIDLPRLRTPAVEIGELGAAFDQVTRTVARHEADLEAAVERQTRLVREVHHRVKNNLQVVASLLNLHSRGSPSEEAAAAYASIQRRVDALAVVHRNHYAELEENRGVALKPLISELAANLRATAPASAAAMQIRLDIGPFYATQDVAVSVAFLVTEITEFGMLSGASIVSIVLDDEEGGTARLAIDVDRSAGSAPPDPALSERFERIITGLSRQLRSTLDRDEERGRYCVRIAVVGRNE